MARFTTALIFGLAVWRASIIMTREEGPFMVFARLREFYAPDGKEWDDVGFLGKLLHCPYCLSFWVSLVIYLVYKINRELYNLITMSLFGSSVTALIEDYYASTSDT